MYRRARRPLASPRGSFRIEPGSMISLAYMTGEYPRATDTFIQREVAALREAGVHVETLSIRKAPENENVGPETRQEGDGTRDILPACPWELFKSHVKLLF